MYHQVGEFPAMQTHRATYCDHRRFATQMAYLKLFGYQILSMNEVAQCLHGIMDIPPRAVAPTFDDAYENFYEYLSPNKTSEPTSELQSLNSISYTALNLKNN